MKIHKIDIMYFKLFVLYLNIVMDLLLEKDKKVITKYHMFP